MIRCGRRPGATVRFSNSTARWSTCSRTASRSSASIGFTSAVWAMLIFRWSILRPSWASRADSMFRTSCLGASPDCGQHVDLAHLAQRRGDHPRRQDALQAGEQVLRPPTPQGSGIDSAPAGRPGCDAPAGLGAERSGHGLHSFGVLRCGLTTQPHCVPPPSHGTTPGRRRPAGLPRARSDRTPRPRRSP